MQDYVNIMEFLIKHWGIASMQGLSVEAQQAQEDLMKLLGRFKKLTDTTAKPASSRKRSLCLPPSRGSSTRKLMLSLETCYNHVFGTSEGNLLDRGVKAGKRTLLQRRAVACC